MVYFEADRVARYEWDSQPPVAPENAAPRFVPAPVVPPQPMALPPGCAAYSADLSRCLVEHGEDGSVWIAALGRERGGLVPPWKRKRGEPAWDRQMTSPDDRLLLAERYRWGLVWAGWDLDDGRPFPLVVDGKEISPLAFSSDGSALAAERRGGEVVVLDTRDGHVVSRTRPLRDRLQSASFASSRIAVSTRRGDVALLDRASGAVTVRLRSRSTVADGRTVAFSPDGSLLAAATSTALELWDVAALEAEQATRRIAISTCVSCSTSEYVRDGAIIVFGARTCFARETFPRNRSAGQASHSGGLQLFGKVVQAYPDRGRHEARSPRGDAVAVVARNLGQEAVAAQLCHGT